MKDGQGNRGWLKPPTPEEGLLDVKKSRGSILARLFKDWMQDVGGDAPGIIGKMKRISRKDAKERGRWELNHEIHGNHEREERLGEEERSLSDRINRIYRIGEGFSRKDPKTQRWKEGEK